jgi:hypothetical protein
MTKRDINFIKHIKPQLKEREIRDKEVSRDAKYRRAGVEPPSLSIDDLSFIASVLRGIKE